MDNAQQQAEELLPWTVFSCETADEAAWEKIVAAVAAALAAKDREVALYRESADSIRNTWNTACAEIERLKKQVSIIDDESEHGQCVHAGTMGPLDCVFCISWAKRNAQLRSQLAVATPRVDGDGLWICLKPPSGREALICLSAKKYGPLVTEVIEETRQWIAQAERKG